MNPRPKRDPICPRCRMRHPYGQTVAYADRGCLRCSRCDGVIRPDGECTTDKCCGWVPSLVGYTYTRAYRPLLPATTGSNTYTYTVAARGRIA